MAKIRKGALFNAILLREYPGRVAVGCPCKCTDVDKRGLVVHAVDSDGFDRVFKTGDFRFERLSR